jgi:hypothetical protein
MAENPKGVPKGVLSITQTSNNNGEVISQEALTGTYEVFEDCSGGSLTFNTSSGPIDIDFWFVGDGTQFVGVSKTPGYEIWTDGRATARDFTTKCIDTCIKLYNGCTEAGFAGCKQGLDNCIAACTRNLP